MEISWADIWVLGKTNNRPATYMNEIGFGCRLW